MDAQHKAFTLIELLIVVAIIAILAAIAVPNFLEAQTRAKVSRSQADVRSIATALEAYAVDHNHYPPCFAFAKDNGRVPPFGYENPNGYTGDDWIWGWMTRMIPLTTPVAYITTIPPDPFFSGSWFEKDILYNNGYGIEGALAMMKTYSYSEDYYGRYDPSQGHPDGLVLFDNTDVRWVLEGLGPDGYYNYQWEAADGYNVSMPNTWDVRTGRQRMLAIPYDPTNGTDSWGDIMRFGGSGGAGNGRGLTFD